MLDLNLLTLLILINIIFFIFFNKLNKLINLYDLPNSRKIHTNPTPCSGGVYLIINLSVFLLFYKNEFFNSQNFLLNLRHFYSFYITVLLVFFVGYIDDLVDFTEQYLDLGKMGGKHSKLWKGYAHDDDIELRLAAIKERVIEILKVDESSEKDDKTMAVYLKKIITLMVMSKLDLKIFSLLVMMFK